MTGKSCSPDEEKDNDTISTTAASSLSSPSSSSSPRASLGPRTTRTYGRDIVDFPMFFARIAGASRPDSVRLRSSRVRE